MPHVIETPVRLTRNAITLSHMVKSNEFSCHFTAIMWCVIQDPHLQPMLSSGVDLFISDKKHVLLLVCKVLYFILGIRISHSYVLLQTLP